jgi:hypothetical protein
MIIWNHFENHGFNVFDLLEIPGILCLLLLETPGKNSFTPVRTLVLLLALIMAGRDKRKRSQPGLWSTHLLTINRP